MQPTPRRVLALIVAGLLLVAACSDDGSGGGDGGEAAPSQPAPEGIDGAVAIRAPGDREHLDGSISYPTDPPIGGDHNEVWANCKFYEEVIPNENAVHSLEHGAVWVAYSPDAPAAELEALRERIGAETHLMASVYEDLDSTYVLSAWERRLELDSLGDPRFEQFVTTYMLGPTTPEQDVECSGGAG